MKQVGNPRIIASTKTLTITGSVAVGGGPHVTFMHRIRIRDLRQEDVLMLMEAMNMEVGKRVRARWDELDDMACDPLF